MQDGNVQHLENQGKDLGDEKGEEHWEKMTWL
jgi:hypothetical protein